MYKRLLVAVDGSEQSYRALDHAIAFAENFGSEIKILAVVSTINFHFFTDDSVHVAYSITKYQDKVRLIYKDLLIDIVAKIRSEHPDIKVSTILMDGQPSVTIVDMVEKERCDMIIMGSRGIGGIKGLVLGSTSHRVSDSCKKPVMIIK